MNINNRHLDGKCLKFTLHRVFQSVKMVTAKTMTYCSTRSIQVKYLTSSYCLFVFSLVICVVFLLFSLFGISGCVWSPGQIIGSIYPWSWVHQESCVVYVVGWYWESSGKWNKIERVNIWYLLSSWEHCKDRNCALFLDTKETYSIFLSTLLKDI